VRLGGKGPQMSRQLELPRWGRDEIPRAERSAEAPTATHGNERSGASDLMERVCERANLQAALKRVRKNKGSAGIDGMTVDELAEHLKTHWPALRERLLAGTYQPSPVRRHAIPKSGGGLRELGIPTVVDRFIQQAILQVLGPRFDPTFSKHSYGFRPGRSAHDAVVQAQRYVNEGRRFVVDVDLEKFFDRVNHDVLMGRLAKRIEDKRVLGLIRRCLEAGVMANGVATERHEGTPQGGPLSPLLANVLLDEVDKELEKRGHAFVRYADDSTNGSGTGSGRCNCDTGNVDASPTVSCAPEASRSKRPHRSPRTRADGGRTPPWPSTSPSPFATSTSWASPGSPRDLNTPNRRMRTRSSGGVAGVPGDCLGPRCRFRSGGGVFFDVGAGAVAARVAVLVVRGASD
jgi:retron-type reverse transcriptase